MDSAGKASDQQVSDGLVATFVIDRYKGSAGVTKDRRYLSESAEAFVTVARRLGFRATPMMIVGSKALGPRGNKGIEETTRRSIFEWTRRFRDHPAERKILYWTGHGEKVADDYYLACSDSYQDRRFVKENAVSAAQLAAWLADDPSDTLLILDACFAQAALRDVRRVIEEAGRRRDGRGRPAGFAVVVTAAQNEEAVEGYWVSQLEKVIEKRELSLDGHRLFHRQSPFIPFGYLLNAVSEQAGWGNASQQHDWYEVSSLRASFLCNPYCSDTTRPASRPPDDETWIGDELKSENLPVFSQGAERWELRDFTPRDAVLSDIVTWMSTRNSGLLTVTGASGAGKSAILNYLAHLTTREFRASLPEDRLPRLQPDLYSIHAAVHCRGKTVYAVAEELCRRLRPLGLSTPEIPSPEACVEAVVGVTQRKGSLTLLFDGLDEAAAGHSADIARRLLNRLSSRPLVKIIVGTRANPRRVLSGEQAEDTLLDILHHTRPPLELDKRPEVERDIERHVEFILSRPGSPYRSSEVTEERQHAASYIAAQSNGIFLVATLWARHLARRDRVTPRAELARDLRTGPIGLDSLLADELDLLDPEDHNRIRDLLRPLALAQGRGLSCSDVWLAMARATKSPTSRDYTMEDLRVTVQRAEGVVIAKDTEFGEDVYHLYHPSFGGYFLSGKDDPRKLHEHIYRALRERIDPSNGRGWSGAHPYLTTYLAAHAALAGGTVLDELTSDYDYLIHASPDVLEPLIATQTKVSRSATLYLSVADTFRRQSDPIARWTLLRATALATPELLPAIPKPAEILWEDVWSSVAPLVPQRTLASASGGAFAVHWAEAGGGVLHTAGIGEVRSWSIGDGGEERRRDTGRATWESPPMLRGVTAAGEGGSRVVVAHDTYTVYLWQGADREPTERLYWGGSVGAVSMVDFEDHIYLAALVDEEDIRIWWWRKDTLGIRSDMRSARLPEPGTCVTLVADAHNVFALVGGSGGVSVWNVTIRGSRPGNRPERLNGVIRHDRPIVALAALSGEGDTVPGRRAQGKGTWIAAVDGDQLHVWLLSLGLSMPAMRSPERLQHFTGVDSRRSWPSVGDAAHVMLTSQTHGRTVVLGRAPGKAMLTAVREGRDIRLWCLPDGEEALLPGESQHASLAFDPLGSGHLAVADGTRVRLWETVSAAFSARRGGGGRRSGSPPKGRALLELAQGARNRHLLCRAYGTDVLLTSHSSKGLIKAARRSLQHGQPITAITAISVNEDWLVATVARRSAAIWLVSGDLDVPSVPLTVLDLHGQDDVPVPSVSLHAADDGVMWLIVPGKQCLRGWSCSEGPMGRWRETEHIWPFAAAATARRVAVKSFPGGPSWLCAWGGEAVRIWNLSESFDRRLPDHRVNAPGIKTVAFGVLRRGTRKVPLAALAFLDRVEVVECFHEEPERKALAGQETVSGLSFAGPPHRPMILGWDSGSGWVRIWDVTTREQVYEIGSRGYEIEAVAGVWEQSGLSLMIQGRVHGRPRCDQIFIPVERVADLLRLNPAFLSSDGYRHS